MPKKIVNLIKKMLYTGAIVVISAAFLVSLTRLLTPILNHHQTIFEKWAASALGKPVSMNAVRVSWLGYTPHITLDDVMVLDPNTRKPIVAMQHLDINIDLWKSLIRQTFTLKSLTLRGMQLIFYQQAQGRIQFENIGSYNLQDGSTGSLIQINTLTDWIFTQARLGLQDIKLRYVQIDKKEFSVTIKKLNLFNALNKHLIVGTTIINQNEATTADINLEWDGDVRQIRLGNINVYLNVRKLNLAHWFNQPGGNASPYLRPGNFYQTLSDFYSVKSNAEAKANPAENLQIAGFQIKNGMADFKIWANWRDQKWQFVQSQINFQHFQLQSQKDQTVIPIEKFSGNIGWALTNNAYSIIGDKLIVQYGQHIWPEVQFSYQVTQDDVMADNHHIRINYFDLAEGKQTLLGSNVLADDMLEILKTINPSGEVHHVALNWPNMDISRGSGSAQLTNISMHSWQSIPDLSHLTGVLKITPQQGSMSLNSQGLKVNEPDIFMAPLTFSHALGDISWQIDSDKNILVKGLNVALDNADLNAEATFNLAMNSKSLSTIDLSGTFNLLHAEKLASYLPQKKFAPSLQKWIQSAFVKGQVQAGTLIINGPLQNFPYGKGEGNFALAGKIVNSELHFSQDWPNITDMSGSFQFAAGTLQLAVDQSHFSRLSLLPIKASIVNLLNDEPSVLTLSGGLKSTADIVQDFILKTPLHKNSLSQKLHGLTLTGLVELELNLSIPLSNPDNSTYSGSIDMQDNTVAIPSPKIDITKINGHIDFSHESLEAQHIRGVIFSQPFDLNLQTGSDKKITATALAKVDLVNVESALKLAPSPYVKGSANFQLQMQMPVNDKDPLTLLIKSDLVGVQINLPENYAKEAAIRRPSSVELQVGNDQQIKAKIFYGDLLSAAVQLIQSNGTYSVQGANLNLGKNNKIPWAITNKYSLTGFMPTLDLAVWQKHFALMPASTIPLSAMSVDLSANVMRAYGMSLTKARMRLNYSNKAVQISMQSRELAGTANVAADFFSKPAYFKLSYFHVPISTVKSNLSMNMQKLPMINLTCEKLYLANNFLGKLSLQTSKMNNGMNINDVSLTSSLIDVQAKGTATNNSTQLTGRAHTTKLSPLLKSWGFSADNYEAALGDATFNLSWAKPIYAPTLKALKGQIYIKLGEGRIIELSDSNAASMGLGKMLNIFSLKTLGRRLSFDFSDLYEEGYSFDSFQAKLKLDQGNAYTENMRLDGPIARIHLAGRIGLQQKDFDVKLNVTPYVTSSLPVVAALAGGPLVGAATWVVDKVFSRAVSRAIRYTYIVKGPWGNPHWTKLGAQPENTKD